MSNPVIGLNRIRLLIDQSNPEAPLLNVLEKQSPELINGEGTQFELMVYDKSAGAFSDSTTITSWTNINSVVIALQDTPNPHNATTFWSTSIAEAAINQSCTAANWLGTNGDGSNGTDQQIKIQVPGTSAYFLMNGQTQPTWLVIYALTTDSPPNPICLAAFTVQVFDAGIPFGLGTFYLLGPDSLVHAVTVQKDGTGNLVLAVEQTGVAGNGISAPFISCPDGVYRTPTLVNVSGQFLITLA